MSTTMTLRGARSLVHTAVITRRNLMVNVRLPDVLILSTVQPVVFIGGTPRRSARRW
jgi:hypothetical protein